MSLPDTRDARQGILRALRGALPETALPRPDLQAYLQGPYGRGCEGPRPDPAALIADFVAAARGWRAEVEPADRQDWPQVVRRVLDRHGCTRIALGRAGWVPDGLGAALQGLQVLGFTQPLNDWKATLFDAVDAGLTGSEAGLADTGTLVLRPGPQEPRTLSLVPPVHVAVLRASTLYAGLPAAMRALAPEADMPTNLLLVTGPSKTADIQQTLAYGAHGPKVLVIVLVDDLAAPIEGDPR